MISAALATCGFALWAVVDRRAREEGNAWSWSPAWGLLIIAAVGGWLLGGGSFLSVLFWSFVAGGVAAGVMTVGVGFWWWTAAPAAHPEPPATAIGVGTLLILIETAWALVILATNS